MLGSKFLVIGSVLFALLISEIGLRFSFHGDQQAFYEHRKKFGKFEPENWVRGLSPHPYFGYVLNKAQWPQANNYGFLDAKNFPYQKEDKSEFVIAVLGGSVAMFWTEWERSNHYFTEELKRLVPKLRSKKITILNMAMGGYKQPQQYFIANYFLESADLFLNLEGYNEAMAPVFNERFLPSEYPVGFLFLNHELPAVENSWILNFLAAIETKLTNWAVDYKFLGNSALYFTISKATANLLHNYSARVAERERSFHQGSFYDDQSDSLNLIAVDIWKKYTKLEASQLRNSQKLAVFFLQPNQYKRGSKQFSDWERENIFQTGYFSDRLAKTYGLLAIAAREMRKGGINVHDLTEIFKNTRETVYADRCCHLNDFGHKILAKELAVRTAQSVRF